MVQTITIARAFNVACYIRGDLGHLAIFCFGRALATMARANSPEEQWQACNDYRDGIRMIREAVRGKRMRFYRNVDLAQHDPMWRPLRGYYNCWNIAIENY